MLTARGNTDTCYLKEFSLQRTGVTLRVSIHVCSIGLSVGSNNSLEGGEGLHYFYILLVVHSNQTLKNRLVCSWGELSHCIDVRTSEPAVCIVYLT